MKVGEGIWDWFNSDGDGGVIHTREYPDGRKEEIERISRAQIAEMQAANRLPPQLLFATLPEPKGPSGYLEAKGRATGYEVLSESAANVEMD